MSKFAMLPLEVLTDNRLTKNEIKVLAALYSFGCKDGKCHPSKAQISERTSIPECKISGITTKLSEYGWIVKSGNGGRNARANYQLKTSTNLDKNQHQIGTSNKGINQHQIGTKTSTKSVLRNKQTSKQTSSSKQEKPQASWKNLPAEAQQFFNEEIITAYLDFRRQIKKPATLYALKLILRSAVACQKDGVCSAIQALEIAIKSSWQGLEVNWVKNKLKERSNETSNRNSRKDNGTIFLENIGLIPRKAESQNAGVVQQDGGYLWEHLDEPVQERADDTVSLEYLVKRAGGIH